MLAAIGESEYMLRVRLRKGTRLSADRQTSRGVFLERLEAPPFHLRAYVAGV